MSQHNKAILDGKTAIVTGGADGLGFEIASIFADSGAEVIVFDINKERLNGLPSVFHKEHVDVTNVDNVQAAIDRVIDKFKSIDILVNNAGFIYSEPLINLTKLERKHNFDAYKKVIDINMNSVFITSSAVAEQMIMKRTKGVIVNISSISASGNVGQTAYSAAKAGVNAFTKTWAKELGAFGIRVVAVSPGFIETTSTKQALAASILEAIIKKIPLKRLGSARDIAQTVLSVVNNQYINGTIIEVDGGLIL